MHELALTQSMVKIAFDHADQNDAGKIHKITVVVGKMSGAVPHSIRFCFEALTIDTIAEGAELIIEEIPCIGKCLHCNHQFEIEDYCFICPQCDSVEVDMEGGKELYIKEMEIE